MKKEILSRLHVKITKKQKKSIELLSKKFESEAAVVRHILDAYFVDNLGKK